MGKAEGNRAALEQWLYSCGTLPMSAFVLSDCRADCQCTTGIITAPADQSTIITTPENLIGQIVIKHALGKQGLSASATHENDGILCNTVGFWYGPAPIAAWHIAHRPRVSRHRCAINVCSILNGAAENALTVNTLRLSPRSIIRQTCKYTPLHDHGLG